MKLNEIEKPKLCPTQYLYSKPVTYCPTHLKSDLLLFILTNFGLLSAKRGHSCPYLMPLSNVIPTPNSLIQRPYSQTFLMPVLYARIHCLYPEWVGRLIKAAGRAEGLPGQTPSFCDRGDQVCRVGMINLDNN